VAIPRKRQKNVGRRARWIRRRASVQRTIGHPAEPLIRGADRQIDQPETAINDFWIRRCHLAYRHGLRASEAAGLRWDSFDLDGGRLDYQPCQGRQGVDDLFCGLVALVGGSSPLVRHRAAGVVPNRDLPLAVP
jgi:hypothetical protein